MLNLRIFLWNYLYIFLSKQNTSFLTRLTSESMIGRIIYNAAICVRDSSSHNGSILSRKDLEYILAQGEKECGRIRKRYLDFWIE